MHYCVPCGFKTPFCAIHISFRWILTHSSIHKCMILYTIHTLVFIRYIHTYMHTLILSYYVTLLWQKPSWWREAMLQFLICEKLISTLYIHTYIHTTYILCISDQLIIHEATVSRISFKAYWHTLYIQTQYTFKKNNAKYLKLFFCLSRNFWATFRTIGRGAVAKSLWMASIRMRRDPLSRLR